MPSDERQQLLSWWLTKLDPDLQNVDLAEAMNDLGICNSADVSGNNFNLYYYSKFQTVQASCLGI